MKSLMIGAIPAEDDYVWKISSEKTPHLTLCYFGDQPDTLDLTRIKSYLQHAIETSLPRFGMSVDRRGTLGSEDADVLFFDKNFSKEICDFRSLLLKNDEIKALYDSVDQYPEWTPHLTLGYPETPANPYPKDRDYPISWVNFDRIAVWTGDYEGEEFLLPRKTYGDGEVAMADVDEFFAHYGIKGMKWGRRKSDIPDGEVRVSQKTPGGKLKSEGGEKVPAHADAIAKAQAKQIATKSGVHALSTKELQQAVNRMNLEQQYSRLTQTDSKAKRAQKAVKDLLGIGKTYNEVIQFQNSPAGQQIKEKINKQ